MRSLSGVLAVLLAGCSVTSLNSGNLTVTIETSDFLVSPSHPGTYRVTARNDGDSRVEWGQGSSGCQLTLGVLDENGTRYSGDTRACTADLVTHALGPGQSRTETFVWGGEIILDGGVTDGPAGTYRLVASAGDRGESRAIEVIVGGQ